MFEQMMTAVSKNTAQSGIDYAQRMMESTLRLTQAQMEVMKGLYDEVGQEFGKTLASSADPAATNNWPQLMAAATRANAEAGARLMKNLKDYQSELLQMMQSATPGISAEFMKDLLAVAQTSPIANGGAAMQAARTKKAA